MYSAFIIYIANEEELCKSQEQLFEDGCKWKNSKVNKINHLRLPVYLFVKNNIIAWSDDTNIVYKSSEPVFSLGEYLKLKRV